VTCEPGAESSAYPPTYNPADAAALQPLATLANGNVAQVVFIPGGWTVLQGITDPGSGIQALLAKNTLPSDPNTTVLVIAMGQLWPGILGFFSGPVQNYALSALDPSLGGPPSGPVTPTTPLFCGVFQQQQYLQAAEPLIFAALKKFSTEVSGLPLMVIGQAQGAPLAQLAAMAFRKSRSGLPGNVHTAACYTFSTPPMGDTNFAALLTQTIPATFNVFAANVDFFATTPAPFPGAVRAGQPQALSATVPTLPELNNQPVDDPWREHSGAYYTGLLTQPTSSKTTPGTVTSPPSGYSADLAGSLTQLIAVAYQQTQHPNSQPSPLVSYALDSFVGISATRWGAIFTDKANKRIFVVFRGEICFEESVNALTQIGVAYPAYLPSDSALAPGMDQIYAALRTGLRAQAVAALGRVGGTNVIMGGHGVGGVLANIAALDFASQGGGLSAPSAVYTFGAPPSGDPNFASAFAASFATSSFQLSRQGDPFPSLNAISGGPMLVGQSLTLNGGSPYDDNIYHSLTSYIALLKSG
jgi:hypothetical protein